jgi:serine/threonine-protein kinase HipA
MTDDLTALRDVEAADVYKRGARAATLTRTTDGVVFAYLPWWVDNSRPPIATTLPVSTTHVLRPGGGLPAYFAGLLPEGRRLGALRREVKTSADDELSLLLAVGADAIGDVQVVPQGVEPVEVPTRLTVADFTAVRFSDLLAELGIKAERTALPGMQDKVSAAMLNLPIAQHGLRFILKLNPPEYPHLVENEACFLQAARLSGLESASATLVQDRDGQSGLLVQRFDRVPQGSGLPPRMLAVEDACQVLGRPPADKYLTGYEQTFGALAVVCQAPLPAARTLLAQLVFAYLSGNGDAHAKNFSVLQDPSGEWRPSPAYDLPSSQPYGDTTMALSLGGRRSGDYGGRDFVALGSALSLPEKATRKLLKDQAERVDAWLPLLEELPFDTGKVHKLGRVVRYRRDRLLQ